MNYPRFASYCLLVAAVLGLFVFMRLTEAEVVCADVEAGGYRELEVTYIDNTTGR